MTTDSLLEFPCDFPLKVMGKDQPEFRRLIIEIIERHAGVTPEPDARASRDGRYVSLSFVVRFASKKQLDGLYTELSGHDKVLFVL